VGCHVDFGKIKTLRRGFRWTSSTCPPFFGWLDKNLHGFSGEV